MPRKTRRSQPVGVSRSPSSKLAWPNYVATALISLGLGIGGTYLALRPALTRLPPVASPALPAAAALKTGNWDEDHGRYPEAIAAYNQAIAGGIDNPDVRTDLGVAYYKSGQPQKALEQYQVAQRQDPHHENSLYNQGAAYAEMGSAAQAITVWQQYIRAFPQGQHLTEARQMIATVQAQAGK